MEDDAPGPSALPEHPDLRDIAEALEAAGMIFEIYDARFRCVYLSGERARLTEVTADEAMRQIGRSAIRGALREDREIIRISRESGTAWFDDITLEEGAKSENANLLWNSSFTACTKSFPFEASRIADVAKP